MITNLSIQKEIYASFPDQLQNKHSFFFWIGNQKSYIKEEKNKCEVQDVHHDEQKEIIEHSTQ